MGKVQVGACESGREHTFSLVGAKTPGVSRRRKQLGAWPWRDLGCRLGAPTGPQPTGCPVSSYPGLGENCSFFIGLWWF